MGLGTGEILMLLLVVTMVFGATKIPQLGKALGEGIKNFKKATQDESIDVTPKIEAPQDPKKN